MWWGTWCQRDPPTHKQDDRPFLTQLKSTIPCKRKQHWVVNYLHGKSSIRLVLT
nr:MAG TPA: hypothetical protein [Caudoviricetes sp.]